MLPVATICHKTPGRLRVKVLSRKGDSSYFSSLAEHFSRYQGIDTLSVNAVTGSALFLHSLETQTIAQYAEANNLFRLENPKHKAASLSSKVVKSFRDFDKKIKAFTGDELDVPGLAFLALLGMGMYQISIGNFMAPAWYTAFWYALNIFLKALPHDAGGAEEAASAVVL